MTAYDTTGAESAPSAQVHTGLSIEPLHIEGIESTWRRLNPWSRPSRSSRALRVAMNIDEPADIGGAPIAFPIAPEKRRPAKK